MTRTQEQIVPDGVLDEKIWQGCPFSDGFIQEDPDEGKPAKNKTSFKAVSNDKGIYIAVTMFIMPGSMYSDVGPKR